MTHAWNGILALTAAALLSGAIGAAQAQQGAPDIRLNVHVDVAGLHPSISFVRVLCEVNSGPRTPGLALGQTDLPVSEGAALGDVTVDISVDDGRLADATHYGCRLMLVAPGLVCAANPETPADHPCAFDPDRSTVHLEGEL